MNKELDKKADNEIEKSIERILLHLSDSFNFGCSDYFKRKVWLDSFALEESIGIRKKDFKESIRKLNKYKFIRKEDNKDGSIIISLTDKGKLRALNLKFKALNNKRDQWDRKWRMVAFDIPNNFKSGRNALRYRLRLAGFYELQESLFLYPYDCEREIREFVELFKIEKYVRFALVDYIDDGERLEKLFRLN